MLVYCSFMTNPELSIIMPLYNNEKYVGEAIGSLLAQSFGDFELIVVNDCSTDSSLEVVKNFNDPRIKILNNEVNEGIVYSRNKGLEVAQGKFIAPFDSDDVAMPEKFMRQIAYLKKHPEIGLLGSWVLLINQEGHTMKQHWKLNANQNMVPSLMLFKNYFTHSAIILRRDAIPKEGYKSGFDMVEDYKLCCDVARKWKVWNFPQYLLKYRIHQTSITKSYPYNLALQEEKIFRILFNNLEMDLTKEQLDCHFLIKNDVLIEDSEMVLKTEAFLLEILNNNRRLKVYDQEQLLEVVFNRWLKICYKARRKMLKAPVVFFGSRLLRKYLVNHGERTLNQVFA